MFQNSRFGIEPISVAGDKWLEPFALTLSASKPEVTGLREGEPRYMEQQRWRYS